MINDHPQDTSAPEHKPPVPAGRRLRHWLLGGSALLLILLAGLLLAGQYLSSPIVINKIQQIIDERVGIKMEFQSIALDYLPQPSVTLQQVDLALPDYGQGKIAEMSFSPALLPLLLGDLRLARLSLEQPELSLDMPAAKSQKPPASSGQSRGLGESLAKGLAIIGQISPDFVLAINQGRLRVGYGPSLIKTEGLDLRLALAMTDAKTASTTLRSTAAVLDLRRNGHREMLRGAELNGSIELKGDTYSLVMKRLSLDEPRLELSGKLAQAPDTTAVTLDVSGQNIDVDATRRAALALAGDVSLIDQIFKYLRSGMVTQITVQSQGQTAKELGALKNLRIEGTLKQGAVSIPQLKLDLTETSGDVLVAGGILHGTGMSTRLDGSTGHDGTLKVGLAEGDDLFQLELTLSADLAQAKRILERVVSNPEFIDEVKRINSLSGTGQGKLVLGDSLDNINASVEVSNLNFSADYQRVPFPIKVASGQISFAKNLISFKDWQGSVGGSSLTGLSCQIELPGSEKTVSQGLDRINLQIDGTLEEDVVGWLSKNFVMLETYRIRTPLKVAAARLDWQKGAQTSFNGGISVKDGPDLSLDLDWQPEQFKIRNLKLKDQYSDAILSLDYAPNGFALDFSGVLQHETLNGLFIEQSFGKGRLKGDFFVKGGATKPAPVQATGQLQGSNLAFALPSGDEIAIAQVALAATGDQLAIDLSQLSWHDLTWDPVKATLDFSDDKPRVRVAKANLCGLNSPGVWTIDGKDLALDVTLEGKSLDVKTFYNCVERRQVKMTGTLDLSGQVSGRGPVDDLVSSLQGPLKVKFSNGVILQDKTLARVLEVLNITQIVKGRLPNLSSEGFAYTTITVQGEFKEGKLLVNEFNMDGETLDVIGQGAIDLIQETVDMELMAAPFKNANTVIKYIPGVNYLMADSLVAIPVGIKGPLDDPKVQVLSAPSIGSGLLKLGERIIKSPIKLIETLTPHGDEQHK